MRGFTSISLLAFAGSVVLAAPLLSSENNGATGASFPLSANDPINDDAIENAIAPAEEVLEGTVKQATALNGQEVDLDQQAENIGSILESGSSLDSLLAKPSGNLRKRLSDTLNNNFLSGILDGIVDNGIFGLGSGSNEGGFSGLQGEEEDLIAELSSASGALSDDSEKRSLGNDIFNLGSDTDEDRARGDLAVLDKDYELARTELSEGEELPENVDELSNNVFQHNAAGGGTGFAARNEDNTIVERALDQSLVNGIISSLAPKISSLVSQASSMKSRLPSSSTSVPIVSATSISVPTNAITSLVAQASSSEAALISSKVTSLIAQITGISSLVLRDEEVVSPRAAAAACPAAPAADAENIYRVDGLVITENNGKASNIQFNVARSPAGAVAVKCRPDTGLFSRFKESKKLECQGLGNGRYKFAWYGGNKDTLWLQYDGYLHSKVAGTSTVPLQCTGGRCEAPCPVYISMVKS